jgi:uncharacterized membrane protein YgcG
MTFAAHFNAPPLNCWIFLAAAVLAGTWIALAAPYFKRGEKCPGWLVPDWIFGDATRDPQNAPLTIPARFAIAGGGFVGAAVAITLLQGVHWEIPENPFALALVGGLAALCAWWGVRGARFGARWVMVRRANPFEVFIAGAAGALVCVWLHSGAGSGSSSSSSSSSSDDSNSSGGGSFGGGGASGKW